MISLGKYTNASINKSNTSQSFDSLLVLIEITSYYVFMLIILVYITKYMGRNEICISTAEREYVICKGEEVFIRTIKQKVIPQYISKCDDHDLMVLDFHILYSPTTKKPKAITSIILGSRANKATNSPIVILIGRGVLSITNESIYLLIKGE